MKQSSGFGTFVLIGNSWSPSAVPLASLPFSTISLIVKASKPAPSINSLLS
jgi:hypothetical protein